MDCFFWQYILNLRPKYGFRCGFVCGDDNSYWQIENLCLLRTDNWFLWRNSTAMFEYAHSAAQLVLIISWDGTCQSWDRTIGDHSLCALSHIVCCINPCSLTATKNWNLVWNWNFYYSRLYKEYRDRCGWDDMALCVTVNQIHIPNYLEKITDQEINGPSVVSKVTSLIG